eukprot:g735.t1
MPSAYTYLRELQKKKSSDVLRFLARIRMWQARMEPNIKKLTRPSRTEKARGLGYKRIPGMSIVRCAVRRGGRKRPNSKGIVFGKPKHQGITQLKFKRSLRSTAEERVGRVYANMRVLNSYWVGQDTAHTYFEIILVDPQHKTIRNNPRYNWIVDPVHKHRELRGLTSAGRAGRGYRKKGHRANKLKGSSTRGNWKRRQYLSLRRYR